MLCTKCGKNPASVYIKNTINGVTTEQHLCTQCAAEEKLIGQTNLDPFGDLFSLFEPSVQGNQAIGTDRCPLCGATAHDIMKSGRAGCASCYDVFARILSPMIKRIHGTASHTGSVPASCSAGIKKEKRLETLRAELKTAIENENFEDAAKLRDEIRELESNKE